MQFRCLQEKILLRAKSYFCSINFVYKFIVFHFHLYTVSCHWYLVNCCWFKGVCPWGLHDFRMDGGLPPGFQKATLF